MLEFKTTFTLTYFCLNKRFIGICTEGKFVPCWHYSFSSGPNGRGDRLPAALCCRGRRRDSRRAGCPRQDPPSCGRSFGCRLLARCVSAAAGRIARAAVGRVEAASAVPLPPPSFWLAQGREWLTPVGFSWRPAHPPGRHELGRP